MRITEYTTVNDTKIDEYLKEGWQPWGSPIYTQETKEIIQAMVKYEEEAPEYPELPDPSIGKPIPDEGKLSDEEILDNLVQKEIITLAKFWDEDTMTYQFPDHNEGSMRIYTIESLKKQIRERLILERGIK